MEQQRLIDMHVHSDNSPDGDHSPMFICEQAVAKELRAVAITDHCEMNVYFEQKYNHAVFHSYFESAKARHAFEGQLLVLIGLEIGQPLYDIELTDKVIARQSYDFIMASIHAPKKYGKYVQDIKFNKIDVYDFMKSYFAELTELAQWKGCDCLAHITLPMRKIIGKYKIDFDYTKVQKELDALLLTVIENGKAIEINTSGLRQDMGRTMPDEAVIRRYRELGGELITVGSDAHSAYDVGAGISEAIALAKKCGFDKLSFFVNREIMQIDI